MAAVSGALLTLFVLSSAAAPAPAPPRPAISVAVFPLTALVGVGDPAAQLLSESLLQEVRNARAFSQVLSPREIATIMPADQQKFLMRCAAEACTVVDNELAGALGVTHIIAGTVGRLGDMYVLNLKLLEVRTSLTLGSAQQVAQGQDEGVLLKVMPQAVKDVLREAGMAPQAAATATSAQPGNMRGVLRGVGLALAAAGVFPLLAALGLVAGGVAWTVLAFLNVELRGRVPAPVDRTPRFLTQVYGPSALLGLGAGLALLLAALCVGGGAASVAGSIMGGG
jgi:hypothetical protein